MAASSRPATPRLHVLSAGAVQGLVKAVQARFMADTGAEIDGRFGAVGAMKEALMSGMPCDVLIVTDAMLRALQGNGAIDAETSNAIGRVRTGQQGKCTQHGRTGAVHVVLEHAGTRISSGSCVFRRSDDDGGDADGAGGQRRHRTGRHGCRGVVVSVGPSPGQCEE